MYRNKKSWQCNVYRGLFAVTASLLVLGCQNQSQGTNSSLLASHDYRLRHPIVVTEAPETLDLPIGRSTRSLGNSISGAVTSFGVDARHNGNGRVEILVPSGGANESAVHAVTPKIRTALQRGGLKASHISTRTYAVTDGSADAPIRLSYARMQATAGKCGSWPKNIGADPNNTDDYNLGCASQANLASIVDNPSDLLTPRASTPADQARRATVFEAWRTGEAPSGVYSEGVGAQVADD